MFFGGLFKARGGGLTHNHRVAGLAGEQIRLAELPDEAGYEHAEAGRLTASAIAHIADMPRRTEISEVVRCNMAGMDGLGAGGLSDRMMLVIRDRENPDRGEMGGGTAITARNIPYRAEQTEPGAGKRRF